MLELGISVRIELLTHNNNSLSELSLIACSFTPEVSHLELEVGFFSRC